MTWGHIVSEAHAGNRHARGLLADRLRMHLIRYVARRFAGTNRGDFHTRQDIAQEALLRIFMALDGRVKHRAKTSFADVLIIEAYARGIVRRLWLDRSGCQAHTRVVSEPVADQTESEGGRPPRRVVIEDLVLNSEWWAAVETPNTSPEQAAIWSDLLSAIEREARPRAEFNGIDLDLSDVETAERLGILPATLRKRRSREQKRLREVLADYL